jgi:hypothetical protein
MKYRLSLPKPPPMSNPHHFRQLSIENTFYLQRTHLHPSVSHTTTRNSHYYPIPNTDSPYRTPPPITHTQKKTNTHTHTHTHAPTRTRTHTPTHTHSAKTLALGRIHSLHRVHSETLPNRLYAQPQVVENTLHILSIENAFYSETLPNRFYAQPQVCV